MDILIRIVYVIVSITVGVFIYIWSSAFKKIGFLTMEELNEGKKEEDMVDKSEVERVNFFGASMFIIIGIIVWALLGVTIGKIASEITDNKFLKWVAYFLMYFIFLRLPFGVGNVMIKENYDFKTLPDKIIFIIVMISCYILSICCYEKLPQFLKWHLMLLD